MNLSSLYDASYPISSSIPSYDGTIPSSSSSFVSLNTPSAFSSTITTTSTTTTTTAPWELLISPETTHIPLNPDTPDWVRSLVWTDFRIAVVFFVVCPLVLLGWSAWECYCFEAAPPPPKEQQQQQPRIRIPPPPPACDSVLRVVTGYWQASSLLLITVLWNTASSPIGVVTGAMAQLMIFLSLNWWESLNDELQPLEMNVANGNVNINPLAVVFSSWRMIASVVAGVGVVIQVPFLDCAAL
eukprot:CAMPEP_0194375490 /NCGR_PEP_ID=MMETSP0174-20130528/24031_1 /TAXON_ID=216777 /ORGANISM="Proboscia alata, Strain PI-D3" /LENGTH=241 /DNA_ID=CAMNT_0039155741 /DNA_START=22 /DNA_END=744 /DNA_ORIENTATION=+